VGEGVDSGGSRVWAKATPTTFGGAEGVGEGYTLYFVLGKNPGAPNQ
jgi:hypothetical protein